VKFISLNFWIFFFVSTIASSQTISLKDYFQLAKKNHPFFKKEALSTQISQKAQDRLLGRKDWVLKSSPFYEFKEPVRETSFEPEKFEKYGLELGTEKAFWSTGARLSFNYSTLKTDQNFVDVRAPGFESFSFGEPKFYRNGISATYSQPLLENLGGQQDKLDFDLAGFEVSITDMNREESEEDFLLELGIKFLDWILLREQSKIANDRLVLANEQLNETKERRSSNLVDQVDLLRAEDAVRIAEQTNLLLDSKQRAKQAQIATLVGAANFAGKDPDFDIYSIRTMPSIEQSIDQLEEKLRLLRILGSLRRKFERKKNIQKFNDINFTLSSYFENYIKPELKSA